MGRSCCLSKFRVPLTDGFLAIIVRTDWGVGKSCCLPKFCVPLTDGFLAIIVRTDWGFK